MLVGGLEVDQGKLCEGPNPHCPQLGIGVLHTYEWFQLCNDCNANSKHYRKMIN
jgi:hypothetical protein